jgi:hypothetical protein
LKHTLHIGPRKPFRSLNFGNGFHSPHLRQYFPSIVVSVLVIDFIPLYWRAMRWAALPRVALNLFDCNEIIPPALPGVQ